MRVIAATWTIAPHALEGEGTAEAETEPVVMPLVIPLAGDLVAQLTRRIGADRAAQWVASKVGAECGCADRRERLNRLDAKLRTWLGV